MGWIILIAVVVIAAIVFFRDNSKDESSGGIDSANINVEAEYNQLITSIETLAKVGAGFGQYNHFFMGVICEKNSVFINMEVKFGNQLNNINNNPNPYYLDAYLRGLGVTENEYYSFLRAMRIVSEDASHDVGTLQIQEQLHSPRHCRAVYDALKNRLVKIPHTRHSTAEKNGKYSLFLHED